MRFLLSIALTLTIFTQITNCYTYTCSWKIEPVEPIDPIGSIEPILPNKSPNLLTFLDHKNGQCLLIFYNNFTFLAEEQINSAFLMIYNPKYKDQKYLTLNFKIISSAASIEENATNTQQKTQQESKYYGINKSLLRMYENQENILNTDDILVHYRFKHNFTVENQAQIQLLNGRIKIQYTEVPAYYSLVIILTIFTLFNGFACYKMTKSNLISQKISLISLYHSTGLILFAATFQLLIGISAVGKFRGFLLISGVINIAISVVMLKYFQSAARRMTGFTVYFGYYIAMFLFFFCMVNFSNSSWFGIINSLFLLPQIVHNVRHVTTLDISHWSFVYILCSNQIYFYYVKGCPENIFLVTPQPLVCVLMVLLMVSQLAILRAQSKLGPIFILKEYLIKNYYNYYQQIVVDIKSSLIEEQCAICLYSLCEEPAESANLEQELELNKGEAIMERKKKVIMKTPCNHRFHVGCLKKWMEYKKECPVDRSIIPPIY